MHITAQKSTFCFQKVYIPEKNLKYFLSITLVRKDLHKVHKFEIGYPPNVMRINKCLTVIKLRRIIITDEKGCKSLNKSLRRGLYFEFIQ